MRPGPRIALARSWALFRAAPGAGLALGHALLFSLVSVCCGLGLFVTPWFLCELLAHQLGIGRGRELPRHRGWLAAAFVQGLAVLVFASVTAMALLSLGSDMLAVRPVGLAEGGQELLRSLGVLAVGGALTIAVTVHFQYTPTLLLERGGGALDAMLHSTRLVAQAGVLRQWAIAVAAHALQVIPAVVALGTLARRASLQSAPWIALALLPVVALGLTLGQGMIAGSYLLLRSPEVPPVWSARRMPATAAAWSISMLALALGPLLVVASLVRPAPLRAGTLSAEATPLMQVDVRDDVDHRVPDTALLLRVSPRRLAVVAGDGGGAGRLPLPEGVRLLRLRMVRQGDWLAVQVETDAGPFLVRFDEAGVRMDDTLSSRLDASLPGWAVLLLIGSFVWAASWVPRTVPAQADALDALGQTHGREGEQALAALRRRGLRTTLALAPAAVGSLSVGLWSWVG